MAAWSLKKADLTDKIDKPAMEAAAWGFESLQGGGVKSEKKYVHEFHFFVANALFFGRY